jgi:hypothetical protein
MKKYLILFAASSALLLGGCQKFLDRKPLDQSAASTFLSNQAEMEQGLVGVYASSFWAVANNVPLLFSIESTTDLAIRRGGNPEDLAALGDAGPFNVNNGIPGTSWAQAYKLVQRANQQLLGYGKWKRQCVSAGLRQNQGRNTGAACLGLFSPGNMVWRCALLPRTMPKVGEVLSATRTPMATIVADMYKDLDEAVAGFNAANTQAVQAMGMVNKGVALGLKAKLALLIKDYRTAAEATKAVIDGGQYSLNPRYTDLFLLCRAADKCRKRDHVQPDLSNRCAGPTKLAGGDHYPKAGNHLAKQSFSFAGIGRQVRGKRWHAH